MCTGCLASHTDTELAKLETAPAWLKPWHVYGNNAADKLADYAASLHTLSREHAKPILDLLSKQTLIQKRLVAVIKTCHLDTPKLRQCRYQKRSLETL